MKPYTRLARVSTLAQSKKYGIALQLEAINNYAKYHNIELQDEYIDNISGASENREALFSLVDNASKYKGVIIYDLTRLARTEKLGFTYLEMLQDAGLEVLTVHRGKIENDLMTGIDIVLSAEERRKTRQRTQSGLIYAAEKGTPPNGIILFGYIWDKYKKQVSIHLKQAEIVKRVFTLSASGESYRAIARQMMSESIASPQGSPKWFQHTVRRIIKNSAYKGEFIWQHKDSPRKFRIKVPAIVDAELWRKAQKKNVGAKTKLGFPLTGRVRCGICGQSMSARKVQRKNGEVYLYYRCNSHRDINSKPHMGLINRFELEKEVEKELRKVATSPKRIRAALQDAQTQEDHSEELAILEDERQRILSQHQKGYITDYELDDGMKVIRLKTNALKQPQDLDFPIQQYIDRAKALNFRQLLDFTDCTVIVHSKEVFELKIRFVE